MMRYKPKLPVYGGSMTEKKKIEFGADFKRKQILGGGPVERAIKADLLSLRKRFYKQKCCDECNRIRQCRLKRSSSSQTIGTIEMPMEQEHKPKGYAFQLFKKVFKEAKFGIIFTRAAPPSSRINNEQYVQLIYSAALSLLKDAIQEPSNSNPKTNDKNGGDTDADAADDDIFVNDENSCHENQNQFFNASFAVFALYILYKTNPSPHIPQYDSSSNQNTKHVTMTSSSTSTTTTADTTNNKFISLTPNEMEILSTLPIFEDENARTFRRSYHSPIRISYKTMQCLLSLRNQALIEIDTCHQNQYTYFSHYLNLMKPCIINCNNSKNNRLSSSSISSVQTQDDKHQKIQKDQPFICKCNLARDCISLIDQLITEQCFHYCEYDGPVGVEGLGGSDEYVRKMVMMGQNSEKMMEGQGDEVHNNNDHEIMKSNLEEVERSMNNMSKYLQIDDIQGLFNQYHNILGKVTLDLGRKSIASKSSLHHSKNKIESIQKTIEPIMKERQKRRCVNFPRKIEQMTLKCNNNSNHDRNSVDLEKSGTYFEEERQQSTVKFIPDENVLNNDSSTNELLVTRQPPSAKTALTFTYPANFSSKLKRGIDKALENIVLLESKRDFVDKEQTEKNDDVDIFNFKFDDVSMYTEKEYSSDDFESVGSLDTTLIAGTGNKALQLLLRKAIQSPEKDGPAKSRNTKKRPVDSSVALSKKCNKSRKVTAIADVSPDDISVSAQSVLSIGTSAVLESGKTALQKLLQTVGSEATSNRTIREKVATAKTPKKTSIINAQAKIIPKSDDISISEPSTFSDGDDAIYDHNTIAPSESGKNALQTLLQTASDTRPTQTSKKKLGNKNRNIDSMQNNKSDDDSISMQNNVTTGTSLTGDNYSDELMGGGNSKSVKERESRTVNDDVSVYSKISTSTDIQGSGEKALEQLLLQVSAKK